MRQDYRVHMIMDNLPAATKMIAEMPDGTKKDMYAPHPLCRWRPHADGLTCADPLAGTTAASASASSAPRISRAPSRARRM